MWETWVLSLGRDDLLEKETATHSSTLAWKIPRKGNAKECSNYRTIALISHAQMVKHLPAMWETWVRSLGWQDLLEKETATHSSTLAWTIPRTEEPGRLQSMGSQRVGHD